VGNPFGKRGIWKKKREANPSIDVSKRGIRNVKGEEWRKAPFKTRKKNLRGEIRDRGGRKSPAYTLEGRGERKEVALVIPDPHFVQSKRWRKESCDREGKKRSREKWDRSALRCRDAGLSAKERKGNKPLAPNGGSRCLVEGGKGGLIRKKRNSSRYCAKRVFHQREK